MKRFLILTFTCLIIAGFVAFLPGTAKASGGPSNVLFGVAVSGKNDGWAVGETPIGSTGSLPLIERLDGNAWQVVSSPDPSGAIYAGLDGVAIVSEHDVWAVGSYELSSYESQTLIEHWNGNQWQIVPGASLTGEGGYLVGVSAISKNNVWAVGVSDFSNAQNTLIEHWNGQSWQVVPSPNVSPSYDFLTGVAARSKDDVWAVGRFIDSNNNDQALIEHWNGSTWKIVSNPAPAGTTLQGVVALSHKDAWAVGYTYNSIGSGGALTEHWNGRAWQVVANPGTANSYLYAVTAVSHNDAWAVGTYVAQNGLYSTLIEHWNGNAWQIVSSPNLTGTIGDNLYSVAVSSHKDVWAVGRSYTISFSATLAEHWNGQSWSIVPSWTP